MTHAVSVADTLAAVQGGMQSLAHTPHIDQRAQAQAETIANSEIPMMSTLETLTRARAAVTPSALVDEQQGDVPLDIPQADRHTPLHIPHVRGQEGRVKRYKLVCSLNSRGVLLQTALWILLVVVTLGVAAPFFAYYFVRLIVRRS